MCWAASATTREARIWASGSAWKGISPESDRMVEELKAIRTRIFDEEIAQAAGRRAEAGAAHPVVPRGEDVSFRWA